MLCIHCKRPIASKNGKSTRCHPCWVKELRTRDRNMKNSPSWKGGKIMRSNHVYIKTKSGKYVAEHRLVMEKKLSRPLKRKEVVHHINGKHTDNRIENLALCKSQSEHIKIYHPNLRK